MNTHWNGIVSTHLSEGLAKAVKTQKRIKIILKYIVPTVAAGLFLAILGIGLSMYDTNMQTILLVIMASLLLPMWVVMPLAQLFTSAQFIELNDKGQVKSRAVIERLAPHLNPAMVHTLTDMLHANTAPCVWWEELEKKTLSKSA